MFRVFDICKKEGLSGNRSACFASVFSLDDGTEFGERHFISSDFDQCAYDSSNHIPEEAIGTDRENVGAGGFFP